MTPRLCATSWTPVPLFSQKLKRPPAVCLHRARCAFPRGAFRSFGDKDTFYSLFSISYYLFSIFVIAYLSNVVMVVLGLIHLFNYLYVEEGTFAEANSSHLRKRGGGEINTPDRVKLQVADYDDSRMWYVTSQQHIETNWNTLQHTATHCSTLQHAATRCNTLQAAD